MPKHANATEKCLSEKQKFYMQKRAANSKQASNENGTNSNNSY